MSKMFEKAKSYVKETFENRDIDFQVFDKGFSYVNLLTDSLFCKIVKADFNCDNVKAALVLKPLINSPDDLLIIKSLFNDEIADILYKVQTNMDDIKGFSSIKDEKMLSSFFIMYRIFNAHVAIETGNKELFNKAVVDHDKLRRYVNSSRIKENHRFIDYEKEIIKHGRNQLSGKPSNVYKYEHLLFA